MKLSGTLALLSLCTLVKSAWWVTAVQPVILSIGAVFAALDLDLQPLTDAVPFLNKQSAKDEEQEEK